MLEHLSTLISVICSNLLNCLSLMEVDILITKGARKALLRSTMMSIAITNGTLIDGSGNEPQSGVTLLVEGERIRRLGRDVAIPRDATVIDAQGGSILPGLIDCHVHLAMEYPNVAQYLITPPSLRLLETIPRMRATLNAGVTTVRDAAGAPAGLKHAVERGIVTGPRMQVAISMISQTGGHGDGYYPCCIDMGLFGIRFYDVPPGVSNGVEEVRKATREIFQSAPARKISRVAWR